METTPSTAGRASISPMNPLSEAITEAYLRISVISWEPHACGLGGRIDSAGGTALGCEATASMSAAYIWKCCEPFQRPAQS